MKSRLKKPAIFRRRFFLSQQDMANYLGVSQTLIAMWEAGKRSLPKEAFEKLLALETGLEKSGLSKKPGTSLKQLQKTLREQENKMAGKMLERSSSLPYKIKMLERRLEEFSKKQQDLLSWLQLIDQKLAALPGNKDSRGERLWFENRQIDATKKVLSMNKQIVKLAYDIDMLRAVVEVSERHSKRLKN